MSHYCHLQQYTLSQGIGNAPRLSTTGQKTELRALPSRPQGERPSDRPGWCPRPSAPRLMQAYRDDHLNLSQLMAFAITEDHARQEAVFERLTGYRDPYHIKRLLSEGHVPSNDRRARLVGMQTYENAGGVIERDLFTEEGGGYFTDAGLLDAMVTQRLTAIAVATQGAEGWKWAEVALDFPYAMGWGRVYPQSQSLSPEDAAALLTARECLDELLDPYTQAEELPDDVDAQAGVYEAEIERLEALQDAYTSEDIARGGIFVSLAHDGSVRIERGLIRADDEVAEPVAEGDEDEGDGDADASADDAEEQPDPEDDGDEADEAGATKPLSDTLLRDLTTHRTLALRLSLAEQPELAARVLAHKLTLDTFYRTAEYSCVEVSARSLSISSFADDLDATPTASALSERHEAWKCGLPEKPADLWEHVLTLEPETLGALMAHCVALTINAVRQPYGGTAMVKAADKVAQQLRLDMNEHWRPTARSYFSRVNKGQILSAVREAVNADAADHIQRWKKPEMAAAAEQQVAGTGWLPVCLRTPERPEAKEGGGILSLPAPEPDSDGDDTAMRPEAAE